MTTQQVWKPGARAEMALRWGEGHVRCNWLFIFSLRVWNPAGECRLHTLSDAPHKPSSENAKATHSLSSTYFGEQHCLPHKLVREQRPSTRGPEGKELQQMAIQPRSFRNAERMQCEDVSDMSHYVSEKINKVCLEAQRRGCR